MGGNGMESMIMLGLMVLVFWFFMIRPQMKKQKELKKYVQPQFDPPSKRFKVKL